MPRRAVDTMSDARVHVAVATGFCAGVGALMVARCTRLAGRVSRVGPGATNPVRHRLEWVAHAQCVSVRYRLRARWRRASRYTSSPPPPRRGSPEARAPVIDCRSAGSVSTSRVDAVMRRVPRHGASATPDACRPACRLPEQRQRRDGQQREGEVLACAAAGLDPAAVRAAAGGVGADGAHSGTPDGVHASAARWTP